MAFTYSIIWSEYFKCNNFFKIASTETSIFLYFFFFNNYHKHTSGVRIGLLNPTLTSKKDRIHVLSPVLGVWSYCRPIVSIYVVCYWSHCNFCLPYHRLGQFWLSRTGNVFGTLFLVLFMVFPTVLCPFVFEEKFFL